ncbi:splicing factor 3A subunit 2-like [Penaeus vannamei]|uniref:splicing factor 3A subunit 2-like n=1 Tax=Penaeus vannamei TaxID=6689 RepID=UPI00387F3AD9
MCSRSKRREREKKNRGQSLHQRDTPTRLARHKQLQILNEEPQFGTVRLNTLATSIMRFLVVLAVLGVCSASLQQAYNLGHNFVQPGYVSDTAEVAAARGAFFRAYQDQLATIADLRYGAPAAHHTAAAVHQNVAAVHHSRQAVHQNVPSVHHSTPAVHKNVPSVHQNAPAVRHSTPTVHQNVAAVHHSTPAVHHNTPAVHHSTPAVHQNVAVVHHSGPTVHQNVPAVHQKVAAGHQSLPSGLGPVQDTPEVSAARAEFFRLYNLQAAAAAAAPDHHPAPLPPSPSRY